MRSLTALDFDRTMHLFRMDLHRLFHGKAFYIMIGISIFIPVMMLTQMSEPRSIATFIGSNGASDGGFGAGMNLSMLVALTGMLLSIYIGKEYSTGFIKNIIVVHANEYDYIMSKLMIALICNATFFLVYLVTLLALGTAMGIPAGIPSIGGLVWYVAEKMLLSIPASMLMIAASLVFRRNYGWSIAAICIVATGIIPLSMQMGLRMAGLGLVANMLDFTVAGASSLATLTPHAGSLLAILCVSAAWTVVWSLVARGLMSKRDVL